jgi:hypothetical protein
MGGAVQVLPVLQHNGNDPGLIDAEATLVGAGVLKLEVTVGVSRFSFALDPDPAHGCLRDLSATVSSWIGVDSDVVLAVIVTAIGQPTLKRERAAA